MDHRDPGLGEAREDPTDETDDGEGRDATETDRAGRLIADRWDVITDRRTKALVAPRYQP